MPGDHEPDWIMSWRRQTLVVVEASSAEAEAPGVPELSHDVIIVDVSGVADLIHILVICS